MLLKKYEVLVKGLRRKQASILFQLRIGHAPLAKHLFTIGKSQTTICNKCRERIETVYHFLMECRGYELQQKQSFTFLGRNKKTMTKLLSDKNLLLKLFQYLDEMEQLVETFSTFNYKPHNKQ
ncbi:hypothetical protein BJ165DRAFT_1347686 [Panaeolus papilionaceus]|nr:hypothetical protein BJ165DRAFT_1347686 [Panaeolus papilionaceus]